MDILTAFSRMAADMDKNIDQEIDIDQIMTSELKGIIDYSLWQETIKIQESLNDSVAPGWKEDKEQRKYDFWMAILDETTEVLNSRHWKWWKDSNKMGNVDWDNVRVELIDLFHFILSIAIQHDSSSIIFAQLANLETNKDRLKEPRDEHFFEDFWQMFLMSLHTKNLPVIAVYWCDFWYRAGGDVNELFMEYRIKAALNKIRQEFGYGAKNTYQKLWVDKDTGAMVEDNVMAWKLAQDVELNKDTVETMTNKLRDYYLENVEI